jgi:uncharacterized repeat protein (TIGR03806 family)
MVPPRTTVLLLALALSWLLLFLGPAAGEPPIRRSPGTVRLFGDPDGTGLVEILPAFPALRFRKPLYIGAPPDGSNRLFVLEQDGVVSWFENRRDVTSAHTALDIRTKVYRRHNEEGLLGMAFHPAFRTNGEVFLHYSADRPRRGVVSRFRMNQRRTQILPQSEQVVLEQPQPWGNHNGGGLAFGPDGYLYLTFGDGGAGGDPLGSGQDRSTWLGSMLRIDVSGARPYRVPPDNPFVGVSGVRPEIWAYGLRNVWRFSFDPVTGDLWGGDVGQVRWEEIDIIRRAGNYGWNLREGHAPYQDGPSAGPLLDPVISLNREDARSITGGSVYRGTRLPDLVGAYVYADYETGNVWALRWDGEKVLQNRLLGRRPGVASFGEDAAGEIYLASFDGSLYTLAPGRSAPSTHVFPRRLSETGLFTDTPRLTPHPALLPYEVNAPLWSDGAEKDRYVMLPGLTTIEVDATGRYSFPRGTIFVKTFRAGGRRLETRLLAYRRRGWEGYTYLWNDEQNDATLIDARVDKPLPKDAQQALGLSHWSYPGRSDCMACHTAAAGYVLGFRAEQIQRPVAAAGGIVDQRRTFQDLGLFSRDDRSVTPWPAWNDERAPLQGRVRAYLDANCAHCHQPGGPGNARIDLRYETPLAAAHLINESPGQGNLGVAGAQMIVPGDPDRSILYLRMKRTDEKGMPNLAHAHVDTKALDAVARWIRGLP